MSLTLEYSEERLIVTLDRLDKISDDISFEKLTLPKFIWAEKTVRDLYYELQKSYFVRAADRPEPLVRLDALSYAFSEVEPYRKFRAHLESLLAQLNFTTDCESSLTPDFKKILTKIKEQFGLESEGREHVRLFREQDCFNSETPPVDIEGLRKAIFVVSKCLLDLPDREEAEDLDL